MLFTNVVSAITKILSLLRRPQSGPYGPQNGALETTQKWTLTRAPASGSCVFGVLSLEGSRNNPLSTLENPLYLIPLGVYEMRLYDSPHVGHTVPLLAHVPGRAEIEIHCGNVPCDSKGCILVGTSHTGKDLDDSRIGFDRLMSLLKLPAQITIS